MAAKHEGEALGLGDARSMMPQLRGQECVPLASVFDPLSARMAVDLGFAGGILAGSVASLAILGAPDLTLLTLTELADLVRRITRAGSLPLLVDADHGYGNALNAARTVRELHAVGAAAMTLEDTRLPQAFDGGPYDLIGQDEAVGKLSAAVAAKPNPDFAIIARTTAYLSEGLDGALTRVRHYARTGVDAVFVTGLRTQDEVAAVAEVACGLPLLLYALGDCTDPAALAPLGVRLLIMGHMPIAAAAEAAWDSLSAHVRHDVTQRPRYPDLLPKLTRAAGHEADIVRFLRQEESGR